MRGSNRVRVDPEDGVECLICGATLRRLSSHLKVHGITSREYRERFPGAPTVGPLYRAIARDLYLDRVAEGTWWDYQRGICNRGHRLTSVTQTPSGKCRKCSAERHLERWKDPAFRAKERAKKVAWYAANREQERERQRKWYAENRQRDRQPPKLKDACRRGHKYTDENTYITPEGKRQCRECRNAWHRRRRVEAA